MVIFKPIADDRNKPKIEPFGSYLFASYLYNQTRSKYHARRIVNADQQSNDRKLNMSNKVYTTANA